MCRFGYGFAIIVEDIGGTAIKQVIPPTGFDIDVFLQIAIRIGMSKKRKREEFIQYNIIFFQFLFYI